MSKLGKYSFFYTVVPILILVFTGLNYIYNILNLPYFWDELGVYSRAAIYLTKNGIGILPNNLPDEISRGHPILVAFLFSIPFKIFGIKIMVARLFAYLIYCFGAYYVYGIFKIYVKNWDAVMASIIVIIQPIFLSQSILIFPELPLMVFTLAAIYYYLKNRYIPLLITLSFAILIKESALVLPVAFALSNYSFNKQIKKSFLILFIPIFVFVTFLIVQKIQNGYYLYPLHQHLMDFNLVTVINKILEQLHFIFIDQGRFIFSGITLFSVILLIYKKKISQIYLEQKQFNNLMIWLLLGGIAFSSINYYLARYIQFFLLPVLMILAIFIVKALPKYIKIISFVLIAVMAMVFLNNKKVFVDTDFAYVNHARSQEKAFSYLIQTINTADTIAYNWPMVMPFWEGHSGYHKPDNPAVNLSKDDYLQYKTLAISQPGDEFDLKLLADSFICAKTITDGYAKVLIYKKKD